MGRFADYVTRVRRTEHKTGCIPRYEAALGDQPVSWAWLAGHYQSLLEYVLNGLKPETIDRLMDAEDGE